MSDYIYPRFSRVAIASMTNARALASLYGKCRQRIADFEHMGWPGPLSSFRADLDAVKARMAALGITEPR